MSLLAHATRAAWGMQKERRELDKQRLLEVNDAKRIQRETGCTWAESLRVAANQPEKK